jgi:ribosomal protein L7/L12
MKINDLILNDRFFKALAKARTAYETYLRILGEEEITEFNVILKSYDKTKRIAVIKKVIHTAGGMVNLE